MSEAHSKLEKAANISVPIAAWILILIVGLLLAVIPSYTKFESGLHGIETSMSNFILFNPGPILLPLVIGAVIGARTGARAEGLKDALRSGCLNGAYSAVIYAISTMVIFEILYRMQGIQISILHIAFSLLLIPIVVLMCITEVFSFFSYYRNT
ncbi:MAG: hypothetical protein M1122_00305 [Candidatus Marsarchaeota archaeon]|jgi:hypothetical protein|nr:hypothetical protein [Candidatus Marsarchaeota archaeon]